MRTIKLTDKEFDNLLLVLGFATGMFFRQGDRAMAVRAIKTTNIINRDNPDWTQYTFAGEKQEPEPLQ
jgi:hypothetical protein